MRFAILALALLACDETNTLPCTGASCACPAGASCDFADGCGSTSCSIACSSENVCNGSCGESCSLQCSGGSTCTVSVGASGSVSCSGGSTCHVSCTDSCSLSCSDSTCDLRCAGESAGTAVPNGGTCP